MTMKKNNVCLATLLMGCLALVACNEDVEHFDNKVYVQEAEKKATILLKSSVQTAEAAFQVAMARPMEQEVTVRLEAASEKVALYNAIYGTEARVLPDKHFVLQTKQVSIPAGSVGSDPVRIVFTGLDTLDDEQLYVLPVTIAEASVGVIESAATMYYVLKGAALINTVPNLTKNLVYVSWDNPSVASSLRQLTAEALIRVDKFGKMLTSVMGIEGYFLIRIGDSGIPDNQLQLATHKGNLTSADLQIPTNKWTHLAVTYDADQNGRVEIYIDGKRMLEGKINCGTIDWAQTRTDEGNGFWIGHSYNRDRWLEGNLCECRIWNRVLAQEEINAKDHFYEVDPKADGLAAYWRFNEGAGTEIQDHTGHGNNATAVEPLTWNAVELPEK